MKQRCLLHKLREWSIFIRQRLIIEQRIRGVQHNRELSALDSEVLCRDGLDSQVLSDHQKWLLDGTGDQLLLRVND